MRTTNLIAVLFAASLPVAVTACGSDNPSGGPTAGCTSAAVINAQQPVACMGTNLVATMANNYGFTSTMRLPPVTVKSKSNLTFDWGAVKHDFLGHAVGGNNSLDTMTLLIFSLPL